MRNVALACLVMLATPAFADHTKFTLNWGVGRLSRAGFGESSVVVRPFFSLNVHQRHKRVDLWGGITFFGGSLERTALSEVTGSYGLTYRLSHSFAISGGHFSSHPALSSAPFTPFIFGGDYIWVSYTPD